MTDSGPPTASTEPEDVFEKLYRDTRIELEERLEKVQADPENRNLRLMPDEEAKYSDLTRHMENIVATKYHFDPRAEENPISFWGLEKQPPELQVLVIKIRYVRFLRLLAGPRAETADRIFTTDEVWPEDWNRIMARFKISDGVVLTASYKDYLKSHWKNSPGVRKPALVRS